MGVIKEKVYFYIPENELNSFYTRLMSVEKKVRNKIARQALREAGRPMLADAKRFAPVKTGALRKSIKMRKNKKKSRKEIAYKIFGDIKYALAVEFGHDNVPPKPYLRPAFDANKEKFFQILTDELERGLASSVKER